MLYEEVVLLVSHINFLTHGLRKVFTEREVKKRSRMLERCAEYHSHIIRIALEVNELHKSITGHMVLAWAVSIGCIINQFMSMYKPAGAILYLSGYMMSLSCFVVSGQLLQSQSESIADELYCIPWYLGTIEEQKTVMFMIMRAQIPLTLSAKPFGNYEYTLYVTVVKTAYSYATLLQNTI
ncbi:unnamed protein product [Acanthoscelides obtectus]|uniref:Uncharacterized protein n=2 Tax=Acanthoscelides obtectus TaxID=200917 RepID=A0A9P0LXM5_ACAOB|nr:unnamed protein product [Acanthoscelides obtectus]CAK1651507.1 Odorant receptor 47b [Acanthoscelides obtectus]